MKDGKIEDKLQKFADTATNVVMLGFFWLICSLPIVTIGASSTALSEATRSYMYLDEKKPLRIFFASFKEHFKLSTIVWLINLALLAILVLDALYYSAEKTTFDIMALGVMIFLLIIVSFELIVVFSCIHYYDLKTVKQAFMKAFDVTASCLIEDFELLIIITTVVVASVFLFRFLLLCFPGLISYLTWLILPNMFRKYLNRQGKIYEREQEKTKSKA